jgi:hypothetical protein
MPDLGDIGHCGCVVVISFRRKIKVGEAVNTYFQVITHESMELVVSVF